MARLRLAIIGFGQLGAACAAAVHASADLELAGVVRHPERLAPLPGPLAQVPVAAHIRDLGRIDAALVCVPGSVVTGVAQALIQARFPLVECARFEGGELERHHEMLRRAAHHHRVPVIVGAGWDPGMLPLLRHAFEILIPRGETTVTDRPGISLHHTEAARNVPGIRGALVAERGGPEGRVTRYVYAELERGADPDFVRSTLAADPLFAGEETVLFPVASIAAIEEGHGVLVERRGTARAGAHQNLLLEGRFDVPTFAARVMLDGARRLAHLGPGAHRYSLWPE